jgi:hypothetical protein
MRADVGVNDIPGLHKWLTLPPCREVGLRVTWWDVLESFSTMKVD